jgi:hypothetical protein
MTRATPVKPLDTKTFIQRAAAMMTAALLSACGVEGADVQPEAAATTSAGVADATAIEAQLALAAKTFLEDRNQQLMDGSSPSAAPVPQHLSAALAARVTRDNLALRELRDTLSRLGERYTGFKTDVRIIETREVDGGLVSRVEERSFFDYARVRGDEPPYTAFRVEREFTFSRQGDTWVLEDVRLLDPDALAPINEVVTVSPAQLVLLRNGERTHHHPEQRLVSGPRGRAPDGLRA